MSETEEPLFGNVRKHEEADLLLMRHDCLFLADNLGHVIERHKQGRNWHAPLQRIQRRALQVAMRMAEVLEDGCNLAEEPQPPPSSPTGGKQL